ncbi:hypothetical protein WICPIJ_008419, partial [Wickerhamomyces pijperi]
QIVNICDEKGLLYENVKLGEDEDEEEEEEQQEQQEDATNVIEDLLVWLSSLSVSSIRALRYTSTLCLYTIETTLCHVIKQMNNSLEVFKKQLDLETAKKQNKTVKSRIEQINKNIETYTNQSMILDSFIQDILNTTFIHRFKDIDHTIRSDSMSALGDWMNIYPEFFFKVTYLKYLGWVLSDENNQVRMQVVKTLVKLLRNKSVAIGSGLRQFLERFKGRVIEMASYDVDIHVKLNTVNLLVEINNNGTLDDSEIASIVSLISNQDLFENKSPMNVKFVHSLLSFISNVETEKTVEALEAVKEIELPFGLEVVRYVTLIRLLEDSDDEEEENLEGNASGLNLSQITKIGEVVFQLARYSSNWEDLLKFFIFDVNNHAELKQSTNSELFELLDLTDVERTKILQLILGNIRYLSETKDEDQMRLFVKNSRSILKRLEATVDYSTFIQAFNVVGPQDFEFDVNEYNEIVTQLVKYFKENNIEALFMEFTLLFKNLAKTGNEAGSLVVVDMINETLIKFVKTVDSIVALEEGGVTDQEELYSGLTEDYVMKLVSVGKSFDVSSVLKEFGKFAKLFDSGNDQLVVATFQLLISAVSWRLNTLNSTNQEFDAMEEFTYISKIMSQYLFILERNSTALEDYNEDLRYQVFLSFADFHRIIKNYFDSAPFHVQNIDKFKDLELGSFKLDDSLVAKIQELFLIKEFNLSSLYDVELERFDEESLDFKKFTTTIELPGVHSDEEQDEDEINSRELKKQEIIWEHEKQLVLITSKILDLVKLNVLEKSMVSRLKLNKDQLGELFPLLFVDTESFEADADVDVDDTVADTQPTTPLNELDADEAAAQKELVDQAEDVNMEDSEIPEIEMEE